MHVACLLIPDPDKSRRAGQAGTKFFLVADSDFRPFTTKATKSTKKFSALKLKESLAFYFVFVNFVFFVVNFLSVLH